MFVYDGYAGGVDFTARGFTRIGALLDQTRQAVAACGCELGCPSCVYSPKCGSGNRPIDKTACLFVLDHIMARKRTIAGPQGATKASVVGATGLSATPTAEECPPGKSREPAGTLRGT